MLDSVLKAGLATLAPSRHEDFILALRFSLHLNPLPLMRDDWEVFGFSQGELYDLKVIVLRPLAYEFLQSQGVEQRKGTLDRKTSLSAYQNRYAREPWLIHLKPPIMSLSYAEWMDLACGDIQYIALPPQLSAG